MELLKFWWGLFLLLLLCIQIIQTLSNIEKRVIGGEIAPDNDYQWTVSLKGDVKSIKAAGACGASIIKTKGNVEWLVTAAHCFFIKYYFSFLNLNEPNSWHARLGLRKVKFEYEEHKKFPTQLKDLFFSMKNFFKYGKFRKGNFENLHIKKIIIHPKYKKSRLEYDIALMQVESSIPIDSIEGVTAIDLPPASVGNSWPRVNDSCVVVGWGCVEAGGRPNPVAKLAKLKIWDNEVCRESFKAEIDLNDKHEFCAGYFKKNYGLCPGDSGSGLACKYNGRYTIAGVVSAAHSRRPGQYPALFSRVSYFRDWIDETISK